MELLVPAGNWEAFLAGINNGADAVYMGGENFNARQRAENFSLEKINKALEYAHVRNKKIYITVNTLIDLQEFDEALDYIFKLYSMGVDAVIVQDLGLMSAIRSLIPGLEIHASTQMTVHNESGVSFLQKTGIKRVVLAREMSLDELKIISQGIPDMELEVFIHGAICYSYSGQCLFSSIAGGRSGNRGKCAGPCRLSYDLYNRDGKHKSAKGKYLLSPADLCLINYLEDLNSLNIDSLKIEGRLKRPEYVATVTRAYRTAIDALDPDKKGITDSYYSDLFKVFNRNFSTGYLVKGNESAFLNTDRPDNRGDYLGKIIKQDNNYMTLIQLDAPLNIGDGIEVWSNAGKIGILTVRELEVEGKAVKKAEKGNIVKIKLNSRVFINDEVYKNRDILLLDRAKGTITEAFNKIEVDASLCLEKGRPLKLVMEDKQGHKVEIYGNVNAWQALNKPLTKEDALSKISRLGDTPFSLKNLAFSNPDNLLVSFSELNEVRRKASQALWEMRLKKEPENEYIKAEVFTSAKKLYTNIKKVPEDNNYTKLSLLTGSVENAEAALEAGADLVYITLESIAQHKKIKHNEILAVAKRARSQGAAVIPVLPRIQKPGEYHQGQELLDSGFNDFMAGNLGSLNWCQEKKVNTRIDYSLNIFNPYSLNYVLKTGGFSACLSPELTLKQISRFPDLSRAELIVHGELMLMVSQYCLLSGVLGNGGSACEGRYCYRDNYYLKDEKGYVFPVETDNNCRFYVFNSRTLCMAAHLERLLALNPYALRIEAHRLDRKQIGKTVAIYREILDKWSNNITPCLTESELMLEQISNSPLTKGHYYRGVL